MTTNICLLRSSVDHKRPTPSALLEGQVAVNISDESTSSGLYFKLTNGALTKVGPVAVSPGVPPNAIPVGSSGNAVGETWLDQRSAYAGSVLKVFDGTYWQTSSGFTIDDNTGHYSLNRELTIINIDANGAGSQSYIRIPRDNLVARNSISARTGMFRFNTDSKRFEGYDGDLWRVFASYGTDAVFNNVTIEGTLDVEGDTSIGVGCGSIVTLDAYTNIKCDLDVRGNLTVDGNGQILGPDSYIGSGSNDALTVRSTSTFNADVYMNENVTVGDSALDLFNCISTALFRNDVTASKNVTLGTNANNSLTVLSSSTFEGPFLVKEKAEFRNEVVFRDKTFHYADVLPGVDNTHNLGARDKRWLNIYTGDLHLKNDRGDWTMIEEKDYLTLRNNETGKRYKILMQEIGG